jgi:hypothetical protein
LAERERQDRLLRRQVLGGRIEKIGRGHRVRGLLRRLSRRTRTAILGAAAPRRRRSWRPVGRLVPVRAADDLRLHWRGALVTFEKGRDPFSLVRRHAEDHPRLPPWLLQRVADVARHGRQRAGC